LKQYYSSGLIAAGEESRPVKPAGAASRLPRIFIEPTGSTRARSPKLGGMPPDGGLRLAYTGPVLIVALG